VLKKIKELIHIRNQDHNLTRNNNKGRGRIRTNKRQTHPRVVNTIPSKQTERKGRS
jgi:hypothetical protein